MLILNRQVDQKIHIGDLGTITVVGFSSDGVKLGFEFPRDIEIWRDEVWRKLQQEKEAAE